MTISPEFAHIPKNIRTFTQSEIDFFNDSLAELHPKIFDHNGVSSSILSLAVEPAYEDGGWPEIYFYWDSTSYHLTDLGSSFDKAWLSEEVSGASFPAFFEKCAIADIKKRAIAMADKMRYAVANCSEYSIREMF